MRFKADNYFGSSHDPRFISKVSGVAANDHVFMLGSLSLDELTALLRARVRVGGITTTVIAGGAVLETGRWYHAALTHDGITLRLHLDGIQLESVLLVGAVDTDPLLPVAVGSQSFGSGSRFFDGLLDDVRVLQRALNNHEITTLTDRLPCFVDIEEFNIMASEWMMVESSLTTDLNSDNMVNQDDLLLFTPEWFMQCPAHWPLSCQY